jgi:hypothetical protein
LVRFSFRNFLPISPLFFRRIMGVHVIYGAQHRQPLPNSRKSWNSENQSNNFGCRV